MKCIPRERVMETYQYEGDNKLLYKWMSQFYDQENGPGIWTFMTGEGKPALKVDTGVAEFIVHPFDWVVIDREHDIIQCYTDTHFHALFRGV